MLRNLNIATNALSLKRYHELLLLLIIISSCNESKNRSNLNDGEKSIIASRWCFSTFKKPIHTIVEYSVAAKKYSPKPIPNEVLYPLGKAVHKKVVNYYLSLYSDKNTDVTDEYSIITNAQLNYYKKKTIKSFEEKSKKFDPYYVSLREDISEYEDCIKIGVGIVDDCADENTGLYDTKLADFNKCIGNHPNWQDLDDTVYAFKKRTLEKVKKIRLIYYKSME